MTTLRSRTALVLGLSTAAMGFAAADAHADVAVNISGPTLTITAIADSGDPAPEVELVSSGGNDYEVRYNTNVGMTVSEDSDRCTDGGTAVSEVQCERDDLTDIVLNADPTADTEFQIPFTDDDDVVFNGGDGNDLLDAGLNGMANADVLNGGAGNDDLEGGDGVDVVNGNGDSDDLDAGDGGSLATPEVVDAGAGNDTDVHGGAGVDTVSGGDGTDTIDGDGESDNLNGGIGSDTLRGGAGNDTLNGDAGNDTLDGGQNAAAPQDSDTLNGGADNDTLRNSAGPDSFNGGANTATGDEVDYSLTSGSASIVADIDGAAGDDGPSCPGVACDGDSIGTDVENLTGDDGIDTLTGNSDAVLANDLDGRSGNDTLLGGAVSGADGPDTFIGGSGTDTVTYALRSGDIDADVGGAGDTDGDAVGSDIENLTGGAGDDDLTGDDDANRVEGGLGDDELQGNALTAADAADTFVGGSDGTPGGQNGANGDIVSYSARTVPVTAQIGDGANDGSGGCPAGVSCEDDEVQSSIENLTGGAGGDTLIGDGDDNRFLGGGGDDTMRGGAGTGQDGADVFDGGAQGAAGDTVSFENRSDGVLVVIGLGTFGGENDVIASNVDNLVGTSGEDSLAGDADANRLDGRSADDVLNGSFNNAGPDAADAFVGGGDGAAGDTVSYGPRDDDVNASIGGTGGSEGDSIDAGVENLTGGDGDDFLRGDSDLNRLNGAGGDDILAGGQGSAPDNADTFIGGTDGTPGGQFNAQQDLATYFNRADPIVANLTTGAGGASGEGDVIDATIEHAGGGSGNDVLTGDAGDNRIEGGGGDDTIAGGTTPTGDGRDILIGGTNGTGGDTASYAVRTDALAIDIGGGANDGAGACPADPGCEDDDVQSTFENLIGGSGADTLTGSTSANLLTGGFGADTLKALAGPDRVEARDGVVDTIDCGTEANDTAVTDSNPSDATTGCETIDAGVFTPPPPPPPPPGGGDTGGGEQGGGGDSQPPPTPPGGQDGVDSQAPQTTIIEGPRKKTRSKRANFEFEASESASFRCKLDSGRFRACTSPKRIGGLDPGKHTFAVVATDVAGNGDPSPASFSWRVKRKRTR
jgi:Ca2+-binding RTX toxin-like protein